jgi:hypothetical protein
LEIDLDRLRQLAGIKAEKPIVAVLLPRQPANEMRSLLDKLKKIVDDEDMWTEIDFNGQKYIATGVERDL